MDAEKRKRFDVWLKRNELEKWICPICHTEYPIFFQDLHLDFIHGITNVLEKEKHFLRQQIDNPSKR